MWDQYQQEYLKLKAIIFVCICDAPRGFIVSGQTKRKSRCHVCMDETASIYQRFLERKHKYRKMKRHFNNTVEKDSASKRYTRKLLFEMVKNIQVGKKRKKTPTSCNK
jgi:hypothetical protein